MTRDKNWILANNNINHVRILGRPFKKPLQRKYPSEVFKVKTNMPILSKSYYIKPPKATKIDLALSK